MVKTDCFKTASLYQSTKGKMEKVHKQGELIKEIPNLVQRDKVRNSI